MIKKILFIVPLSFVLLMCTSQEKVKLEFRIAEDEPAPGLTEMIFAPSGERFFLHNEVLLTESDIDSAFVIIQNNHPAVKLILTTEGSRKFEELTENYVGKRCGMILNGELVSAPRIMAPIHVGLAIISGVFTKDEANDIAEKLSQI